MFTLERHSRPHSVDHMSLGMVDRVPSYILESSFPALSLTSEDNEAGIRMIT